MPPTSDPKNLLREPYRLLFPVAMLLGIVSLTVWGMTLSGTAATGLAPRHHGLVFIWGFLGTAVLGFFFTAFPRQNGAPQPGPAIVISVALAQILFVALGLLGLGQAAAGVGTVVWGGSAIWTWAVAVPSLRKSWDGTSAGAPVALTLAAVGVAAWPWAPKVAADVGVLGFLMPLALLLLDRVLPFFSAKRFPAYTGRRSAGFMPALLIAIGLRLLLRDQPTAAGLADLMLFAVLVRQWVGWRPDQTWREPLIFVLHLGVFWLVFGTLVDAAFTLSGAPSALLARHLWTVGGMTTLLIGIAVRVVRGHGGQGLRLGVSGALCLVLVQEAALTRGGLPLIGISDPILIYILPSTTLALALLVWLLGVGPGVLKAS